MLSGVPLVDACPYDLHLRLSWAPLGICILQQHWCAHGDREGEVDLVHIVELIVQLPVERFV